MKDYKSGSHTVWDCKYHLVWITKYRYPVLVGESHRLLDVDADDQVLSPSTDSPLLRMPPLQLLHDILQRQVVLAQQQGQVKHEVGRFGDEFVCIADRAG